MRSRSLAALLAYVAFLVGFLFHTSPAGRVVLGKYSLHYAVGLAVAAVAAAIAWWYMLQVARLRAFHLPSGRELPVRTSAKLLTLLIALILAAGAAEFALSRAHRAELAERAKRLARYHPYLQVAPQPNEKYLSINQWGFRGEPITKAKPPGTYRVFVLGGSTVFCDRATFEKSHCRLLELRLRDAYPHRRIEVQNAGMHWHTSLHSLIKFYTTVQDFHPDLIILYHAINDLYRGFSPDDHATGPYRDDYGHFTGPVTPILRAYTSPDGSGCFLLHAVTNLLSDTWYSDFRRAPYRPLEYTDVTDWRSLPAFRRNMDNLAAAVLANGIDLVMASQPYLYKEPMTDDERRATWMNRVMCKENNRAPSIHAMIDGMQRFNDAARQIAERRGVPFVDLEARVPKDLDHFLDDVHYTERGNAAVADAFAEAIINAKLIDRRSEAPPDEEPPK